MPTTVNSDMVIYNDLAQTAYLERVQDVIEIFNQNSRGAFSMVSEVIEGDLRKRSFYQVGGSIAHRDVNSDDPVTPSKIGAGERVGVKCPWKYGPYSTTEEAFKRRARSPEEFSTLMGQDLADAAMTGWVEFGIGGVIAAIRSNAAMVVSGSLGSDGKKVITKGMRKFGDRFNRIAVWAMNSALYFDIVDQAIDAKIYEEAGMVIYGGSPGTLGKPVLVTDKAPEGVIAGLQPGAITVTESQAPGIRSYQIDDQENLALGFRAEGTFNLDVMGYSYDEETGGINPNQATIGDSDSWEKWVSSDKLTAGVVIDVTDATT